MSKTKKINNKIKMISKNFLLGFFIFAFFLNSSSAYAMSGPYVSDSSPSPSGSSIPSNSTTNTTGSSAQANPSKTYSTYTPSSSSSSGNAQSSQIYQQYYGSSGATSGSGGQTNQAAGFLGSAIGGIAVEALTSGGSFEDSLKDIAGNILECSVDKILSQGLSGILKGIGSKLFGGVIDGVLGNVVGGLQSAVGGAVGSIAGGIAGGVGGAIAGNAGAVAGGQLGGAIGQAAGGIVGGALGAALGLGPSAVPVNTVSINPDIKAQTAKEIGSVEGGGLFQTPSLDSIAYCLANSVVQYTAEGSARWLSTGNNGNPVFIENYPRYFKDIEKGVTEQYLNDLAKSNVCAPYKQQLQKDVIASAQKTPFYDQTCQISNVNGYQEYFSGQPTENSFEAYLTYMLDPQSKYYVLQLEALAEDEERRAVAVKLADIELRQEGVLQPERDPSTGDIIVPGPIRFEEAVERLKLPIKKLGEVDEIGEALDNLFGKIFSIVPGGLLKKVLQQGLQSKNKSSSSSSSSKKSQTTATSSGSIR